MSTANGSVRGGPLILLRVEGATVAAVAILAYAHMGHSWWAFLALILVPDASMLGYLVDAKVGAISYNNAAHTVVSPAILAALGFSFGSSLTVSFAVIWVCHIGLDRMLGYGLKYATGFGETHLGQLGMRGTVSNPLKHLHEI
jgi:hypothetical protein